VPLQGANPTFMPVENWKYPAFHGFVALSDLYWSHATATELPNAATLPHNGQANSRKTVVTSEMAYCYLSYKVYIQDTVTIIGSLGQPQNSEYINEDLMLLILIIVFSTS